MSSLGGRDPSARVGLLALAWILGLCGPLRAYDTLGGTWPGGIASFRVNPNFPDLDLSGSPDEQIEVLVCATDAWRDQSRADFRFEYDGTTTRRSLNDRDGENVIFHSSADGGDALAATLFTERGGVATSFDIVFFASSNDIPNDWSGPADAPNRTLDIQGVAVHELGHALGLGHSDTYGATMYPSLSGTGMQLRSLGADDRAGIEFLYGLRTAEPPTVTIVGIDPPLGPSEGGNEVVIEGVNFTYTANTSLFVDEKSLSRSQWTVESCGRLTIESMPPHKVGPVTIRLTNDIGEAVVEDGYLYTGSVTGPTFLRGDVDGNERVNITDAMALLDTLFLAAPMRPCDDAADINDDGAVDISDAVTALLFLFQPLATPIPEPYPDPGPDPTDDPLDCAEG